MVQIAEKFENFLEVYRRQDGSRWGGQDLHDATGGVVTLSYISSLENPGFEKLRTIGKAMTFPLNVRRLERGGYNRLGVPLKEAPRADRFFERASEREPQRERGRERERERARRRSPECRA